MGGAFVPATDAVGISRVVTHLGWTLVMLPYPGGPIGFINSFLPLCGFECQFRAWTGDTSGLLDSSGHRGANAAWADPPPTPRVRVSD